MEPAVGIEPPTLGILVASNFIFAPISAEKEIIKLNFALPNISFSINGIFRHFMPVGGDSEGGGNFSFGV